MIFGASFGRTSAAICRWSGLRYCFDAYFTSVALQQPTPCSTLGFPRAFIGGVTCVQRISATRLRFNGFNATRAPESAFFGRCTSWSCCHPSLEACIVG